MNHLLERHICTLAAELIYQSYSTITLNQAFTMAIGEAEVEFNTDINLTLSQYHESLINTELSKLINK